MLRDMVLATRNPHKAAELAAFLGDLPVRIHTVDEFPGVPDVVEDGDTCEANAIKKATVVFKATGLLAVADDTGLEVDALEGRPGVYAGDQWLRIAWFEGGEEPGARHLATVSATPRTHSPSLRSV